MDGISSIQTIGQPSHTTDPFQYQGGSEPEIQGQPLSYDGSLTIEDRVDEPLVLNISGASEVKDLTAIEKIMQTVVDIDSDHNKIINRLNDWPDFNNYLEKRGISFGDQMGENTGITHISNVDDIQQASDLNTPLTPEERLEKMSKNMDDARERHMEYQAAAVEYTRDSTVWSSNAQFFSTKVKLLTAAVSQVNSGLKTLFTSQ